MVREISPELEKILGTKFPVLDNGFIIPLDYMGNDKMVVERARKSYGKGTKSVSDDETLLRYMVRLYHSGPLEFPHIQFHLRIPFFAWNQLRRYRTANVEEMSGRYSKMPTDFMKINKNEWRRQSTKNKQGSIGIIDDDAGERLSNNQNDLHIHLKEVYEERLGHDVAREIARIDLPLSAYTEVIWQQDLHNLLHVLEQRLADDAQYETREYAEIFAHIVSLWCPIIWKAFVDYRLECVRFSKMEQQLLSMFLTNDYVVIENIINDDKIDALTKREKSEFLEKIRKITERK